MSAIATYPSKAAMTFHLGPEQHVVVMRNNDYHDNVDYPLHDHTPANDSDQYAPTAQATVEENPVWAGAMVPRWLPVGAAAAAALSGRRAENGACSAVCRDTGVIPKAVCWTVVCVVWLLMCTCGGMGSCVCGYTC